jgi:hypothetical protein
MSLHIQGWPERRKSQRRKAERRAVVREELRRKSIEARARTSTRADLQLDVPDKATARAALAELSQRETS